MRSHTHDTPLSPANAFDRSFLDVLDPEDDPVPATEAAAEGPWTVVRIAAPKIPFAEPHGPEPWAVVREGEAADDEPAATFVHLHPARLAAAAVPIAARDAVYRLDRQADGSLLSPLLYQSSGKMCSIAAHMPRPAPQPVIGAGAPLPPEEDEKPRSSLAARI